MDFKANNQEILPVEELRVSYYFLSGIRKKEGTNQILITVPYPSMKTHKLKILI